jgi:hypothetical protein
MVLLHVRTLVRSSLEATLELETSWTADVVAAQTRTAAVYEVSTFPHPAIDQCAATVGETSRTRGRLDGGTNLDTVDGTAVRPEPCSRASARLKCLC